MAGATEKSPLLSEPSLAYGVPAATAATKEPREFKGRWFHLFGDCSPADVSASCLAIHAPAVAYGWNAQRGLGLTWWKEALKLLLLTCGVFALIRVTLVVLVETQCPDVAHGRMGHGGPHAEPWLMPRDGAALPKPVDGAQAFPMDDPRPRPEDGDGGRPRPRPDDDDDDDDEHRGPHGPHDHDHPRPDDDDDDDDDEHRGPHGPHDHDHPHPRPDDDRNGTEPHGHDHPHPRPFPDNGTWPDHGDNHTHPHGPHGPHGPHHDDDDDDDDHEHGHWWPHHHHHHDREHRHWADRFDDDDDDDMMPPLTKEEREALHHCAMRVGPWAILLASVGLTAFGYAVYIAALRRRMLRERFGIDGSFKHDVLLWLGCAPCALAQETRTLMYNHVEEGLWHGPLVTATAPRQVQPMTA